MRSFDRDICQKACFLMAQQEGLNYAFENSETNVVIAFCLVYEC